MNSMQSYNIAIEGDVGNQRKKIVNLEISFASHDLQCAAIDVLVDILVFLLALSKCLLSCDSVSEIFSSALSRDRIPIT